MILHRVCQIISDGHGVVIGVRWLRIGVRIEAHAKLVHNFLYIAAGDIKAAYGAVLQRDCIIAGFGCRSYIAACIKRNVAAINTACVFLSISINS